MTNYYDGKTKISEMPPLWEVGSDTEVPVLHEGDNYRAAIEVITNYILNNIRNRRVTYDELKMLDYPMSQGEDYHNGNIVNEILAFFNAGYDEPRNGLEIIGTYTATELFRFATPYIHGQIFPSVALVSNNRYTLPMESIRTVVPDYPAIRPSFSTVGHVDRAMNIFAYRRPTTQYSVLTGSIDVLVRVSHDTDPLHIAAPKVELLLAGRTIPTGDSTEIVLAADGGFLNPPLIKLNARTLLEGNPSYPLVNYEDAVTWCVNNGETSYVPDMVNGSFYYGSGETLVDADNPYAKTTEWFEVPAAQMIVVQALDGESNVCRVQWKDVHGSIHFDEFNSDGNVNKIMCFLPNAHSVRICCNLSEADTVSGIQIWSLPEPINPYGGWWGRYRFNVANEVTFLPDTFYSFELHQMSGGRPTEPTRMSYMSDSHSVMVLSGGFTAITNVRDVVQTTYDEMVERDHGSNS